MERAFKYLGSAEQMKNLWQNKEALEKYIARLNDFWDEENQCWLEKRPKVMEYIDNQDVLHP